MNRTPGPWVIHPSFPEYIVPADHAARSIGGADDLAYDLANYAQPIAAVRRKDRHRTPAEVAGNAGLIAAAPDLEDAAKAALAYDAAIQSCAGEPERMSSFCTAEGEDLDDLYSDWIGKSRAALAKAGAV